MKTNHLLAALMLSASLAACGGGGNSDKTTASGAASASGASAAEAASGASSVLVPTPGPQSNHPDAASSVTVSTTPATSSTAPISSTGASSATNGGAVSAPSTNGGSTATPSSGTSTSGTTSPTTGSTGTTTPATGTTSSIFYGVNGHATEGGAYDISSDTLQLQQLKDLGAKIYRNEVIGTNGASRVAARAKVMAAGGIAMDPVMLLGIDQVSNETDGYNQGVALGKATAQAYPFPYIEVTNEIEASCLTGNVDGVNPTDYDNTKFQKARGIIRGMIDGVKSVNGNTKIIMGGGAWLHYGFYQMLAKGTQPDGTAGHPVVSWDITAWHWYSDQGDIEAATGGTGTHNVLQVLKDSFGKPIWLNEFGVRPNYGTDDKIATYLTGNKMMAEFVKDAPAYNIQSIQFYELYDDPAGGEGAYGLLKNDGKTQKASYSAYKNFVAAYPK